MSESNANSHQNSPMNMNGNTHGDSHQDAVDGQASADIEQVIDDAQRLIAYIAKDGNSELDAEVTRVIVNAKYRAVNQQWSSECESEFLLNYDKLAKIVYPVTVASLNSTMTRYKGKVRQKSSADKTVSRYRRLSMVTLTALLIFQVYWLCGHALHANVVAIDLERQELRNSLLLLGDDRGSRQEQRAELVERLNEKDYKFDANYKLLKLWLFGYSFDDEIPPYFKAVYDADLVEQMKKSAENIAGVIGAGDKSAGTPSRERLREGNHLLEDLGLAGIDAEKDGVSANNLDREKHKARILVYQHVLSAKFILQIFQSYILPLLYGLLGALIFILRNLMNDIRALTYNSEFDIRFRLRLTLGALGGMFIGWFLKPDDVNALASLSPMALAFIAGYTIDNLFLMMDRSVDKVVNNMSNMDTPAPEPAVETVEPTTIPAALTPTTTPAATSKATLKQ